jgi:SWI/SNF-related matrix-associated actin-dependent regulator 1 of chromatin subfamily A
VIIELTAKLAHYRCVVVTGAVGTAERQKAVESFQNSPEIRLFIGQFQAAGDGITLTAANTVVFVESSWTPAEIEQAADRVHRIGQKKAVLVQFLVIEKSFEEYMLRTAIDKRQIISEIVDGN